MRGESESASVERGELNAVIGRQPQNVDLAGAHPLEIVAQAGRLAMTVVKETAVAVDLAIRALAKDLADPLALQPRRELRARRALDTMIRPEDLIEAVQIDGVAGRLAGMLTGERAVVGRVPVLRRHNQIELRHQPIRDRDHLVAIRHRQRAAGQKIDLNIDHDQSVHSASLAPGSESMPRASSINLVLCS